MQTLKLQPLREEWRTAMSTLGGQFLPGSIGDARLREILDIWEPGKRAPEKIPMLTTPLHEVIVEWDKVSKDNLNGDYSRSGLIDDDGLNLGGKLRWRLLLAISGGTATEFNRLNRRQDGTGIPNFMGRFGTFGADWHDLRPGSKNDARLRVNHVDSIIRMYTNGRVGAREFEFGQCIGKDAPWIFIYKLLGMKFKKSMIGDCFLNTLRQKKEFKYLDNPTRQVFFSELLDAVRATPDRPGRQHKNIISVYSADEPSGLTALAIELFNNRNEQEVPWLYLPVQSDRTEDGDGRFSMLVARLAAFYDHRDPASARPGRTDFNSEKEVAFIRRRMAEEPAVIIFDGFSPMTGDHAALLDFIRDEPLVDLLHRVIHPFRGEDTDPNIFLKTVMVVLGTTQLARQEDHWKLKDYCTFERSLVSLPDTDASRLISIMGSDEVEHGGEGVGRSQDSIFREMIENYGILPTETNVWIMKSIYAIATIEKTLRKKDGFVEVSRAVYEKIKSKADDLAGAAFSFLLDVDQRAARILAIIAIAMTEIGVLAIHRILWRWSRKINDPRVRFDTRSMNIVISAFSGIVHASRGESIPALYRARLGRDFPLYEASGYDWALWGDGADLSGGQTLAYDIHNEAVRIRFIETYKEAKPAEYLEIQLLLSEMAMQQFSIISRNTRWPELDRARFYRLLVQGLYHGFLSVSPDEESRQDAQDDVITEKGKIGSSSDLIGINDFDADDCYGSEQFSDLPSILPNDPSDRLSVLFGSYYLEVLERRPIWAVTRLFAIDAVKADLLDLARERILNLKEEHKSRFSVLADEALRSSARTALWRGDSAGLKTIERTKVLREHPFGIRSESNRSPYTKLNIDKLLLDSNYDGAEKLCDARLRFLLKPLKVVIDTQGDNILKGVRIIELQAAAIAKKIVDGIIFREEQRRITVRDSLVAIEKAAPNLLIAIKEVINDAETNDGQIREIIDLLERLGVIAAHRADERGWKALSEESSVPGFKRAYYFFRVSQLVPRMLTKRRPFLDHRLTASSSRMYIRTALKLGKAFGKLAATATPEDRRALCHDRDIFFARARQHADRLARQLHPFPSERASMLIIESGYARIRLGDPKVAAKWLREAEELMPPERNRPRLIMRFLLERGKVFRRLSENEVDLERRKNLKQMALFDVVRLGTMAETSKLDIFVKLARHQRKRIDSITVGV